MPQLFCKPWLSWYSSKNKNRRGVKQTQKEKNTLQTHFRTLHEYPLNKISANWIQQCIKNDNPYVYKAFITGTEVEFDVRKSINVVPSMNRLKDKTKGLSQELRKIVPFS